MGKVIKLFFMLMVIKLLFFSLIPSVASSIIPYKATFAYPERIQDYHVSPELSSRANFDGIHYLLIARQGYTQYQQAFFPLYPLLIRGVSVFTNNNDLVAGVLISRASFAFGILVLLYLVKKTLPKTNIYFLGLFLVGFPTAFFFDSIYTEGLFFMLATSCLWLLHTKQFVAAGAVAGIASFTRLVGAFLVIPIAIVNYSSLALRKRPLTTLLALVLPFAGIAIYMAYLKQTTGDPVFFLNAQPAFGAQRSTHIILLPQVYFRYLKIFVTAHPNYQYFIALLEFLTFNLMMLLTFAELRKQWISRNYLWIGVGLFSAANLILPTLTGTFSSVPRYALLSISAFIYLAGIRSVLIRVMVAFLFFISQIVLFAFFCQGYFVS